MKVNKSIEAVHIQTKEFVNAGIIRQVNVPGIIEYMCSCCDVVFNKEETRNKHGNDIQCLKLITCNKCNSMSETADDVKQHIGTDQQLKNEINNSFKVFKCSKCENSFRTQND